MTGRRPRPIDIVGALIVLAIIIGVIANRGSSHKAAPAPKATTPLDCLQEAGLSNVEQRTRTFFRGNNLDPFFMIGIDRLPSKRAAARAVHDADLVWSAQSGRYFVSGPSKSVDAQRLVTRIMFCLDGVEPT
jgi:hypothetical protein